MPSLSVRREILGRAQQRSSQKLIPRSQGRAPLGRSAVGHQAERDCHRRSQVLTTLALPAHDSLGLTMTHGIKKCEGSDDIEQMNRARRSNANASTARRGCRRDVELMPLVLRFRLSARSGLKRSHSIRG